MASTYSSLLRLELIGTGDQTGTWGNTTNTNLGTLIDQAVAGTAVVDVTVGDVTLTALNGASDQSRQAILRITGTPNGARNVIAPEQSKAYFVTNQCGQIVTIKGSSTSGFAIADGVTALVIWDGEDFVPGSSTSLGYTPVNIAGDTMTGALYLPAATPTISTQAATKGYVDSAVSGVVGSNYVLKAGDTMTGNLILNAAPTSGSNTLQAATKGYVDNSISNAGFATQSWVTSQSYVTTTTTSLSNYTTTSSLSTTLTNLGFVNSSTTSLSNYTTTSNLSNYLSGIGFTTTNDFVSSKVSTGGYQKLPGGLIIQWGQIISSGTSSGNWTGTFPIAFPNAFLRGVASVGGLTVDGVVTVGHAQSTSTTIVGTTFVSGVITSGIVGNYIAIGY